MSVEEGDNFDYERFFNENPEAVLSTQEKELVEVEEEPEEAPKRQRLVTTQAPPVVPFPEEYSRRPIRMTPVFRPQLPNFNRLDGIRSERVSRVFGDILDCENRSAIAGVAECKRVFRNRYEGGQASCHRAVEETVSAMSDGAIETLTSLDQTRSLRPRNYSSTIAFNPYHGEGRELTKAEQEIEEARSMLRPPILPANATEEEKSKYRAAMHAYDKAVSRAVDAGKDEARRRGMAACGKNIYENVTSNTRLRGQRAYTDEMAGKCKVVVKNTVDHMNSCIRGRFIENNILRR